MTKRKGNKSVSLAQLAAETEKKQAEAGEKFNPLDKVFKAAVEGIGALLRGVSPFIEAKYEAEQTLKSKRGEIQPALCKLYAQAVQIIFRDSPRARKERDYMKACMAKPLADVLIDLPAGGKDAQGRNLRNVRAAATAMLSKLHGIAHTYQEGGPLQEWADGNYNAKNGLEVWYGKFRTAQKVVRKLSDTQRKAVIASVTSLEDADSRQAVVLGIMRHEGADRVAALLAILRAPEALPQIERQAVAAHA